MNVSQDLFTDALQFRAVWGRLVGVLTRTARLSDPALAEDAVQYAMLQATRLWPMSGWPDQPLAWLTRVARNHLTDALRARSREVDWLEESPAACVEAAPGSLAGEISDEELALLFACCDPVLPVASQVALALKVVAGFSLREIAAGLMSDESALAQRLARARQLLAARSAPIGLPAGPDLPPRREAVLVAIHLLFNEGYSASVGESAQRPDMCREAIRLACALAVQPGIAHPDVDALAALLLLQGARLATRVDAAGDWLLLESQDRSRWDRRLLSAGLVHLERARRAERLSAWHLRAGIVAEHVTAQSFGETDWERVLLLYDALIVIDASPATALARSIALAHARGAAVALPEVEAALAALPRATHAYGLAARAELLGQLGRGPEARADLEQAVAAAPNPAAARLLRRKLTSQP